MTGRHDDASGQGATGTSALEALLAGYAAGSLPLALHALVGAHLELCPANRTFVASLEEALGKTVVKASPCVLRAREARLEAIFCCESVPPRRETSDATETVGTVTPKALQHFLGKPVEALVFRSLLSGIRECRLETGDATRALVYRIRAGRSMPKHSHEGSEITLVLQGGFSDKAGHFRRGDIAVADEQLDHAPTADPDEECICFAVLDAPMRLTVPFGRLFNRFIRN